MNLIKTEQEFLKRIMLNPSHMLEDLTILKQQEE